MPFDDWLTERCHRYRMTSAAASSRSWLLVAFSVIAVLPSPTKLESIQQSNSTEQKEWRESILSGISSLEKIGYPGRIVVFGKQAEPILTGTNAEDVLVAAAEFGKGRIVAISHTSYSNKFTKYNKNATGAMEKFHDNLKKWLTKGTFGKNDSIVDARDNVTREMLESAKIVVYHGKQVGIDLEDLTEFVRNGGALLHSEIPWKWLNENEGEKLTDAPYATLLSEAGLCYTDGTISVDDAGFSVKDNKASGAHLLRVLDESGKNASKAIDQVGMLKMFNQVPENVFLQLKSLVETAWETCSVELNNDTVPGPNQQVTSRRGIDILKLWMFFYDLLKTPNVKVPGVNLFPGDFLTEPTLKSHTLEFHSDIEDFHSTGCYLPAGQTLKVQVLSGNDGKNWQMRIGCHNDDLKRKEKLKRWPKVSKTVKLDQNCLDISSPFGGLIYLISPDKINDSISVKLENVVDSPRFRLTEGEKGEEKWNQSRNSPGLWADIEGEHIRFTLPTSSVKVMGFYALTSVMKIWDSIVRLYHDLRGTDLSKFRRTWIVPDVQPSASYMHSGHPVVTQLNVAHFGTEQFLLNRSTLLRRGSWGVFHEMGHNMPKREFTFEGTGEVTANIFTLYALDEICDRKSWSCVQDNLNKAEAFFQDGAKFATWKRSSDIALVVYTQLAHEFGWESYKKVFRSYLTLSDEEKPRSNQEKMDKWFSTFSEAVGCNLAPLASFWNIPLSADAVAQLGATFPVGFLPDDEVTRLAPDRVDAVLRKFPGTVRNISLIQHGTV